MGYSPWDRKKSDMTEYTHTHHRYNFDSSKMIKFPSSTEAPFFLNLQFGRHYQILWSPLVIQTVKNLPAMQEDSGLIPELEKEMATHSNILVWEIPWTKEPDGHSPWGSQKSKT